MLVALAGTGGLWCLLHYLETHPGRAWFGLALCYLLALFAKESASVIPAIAVSLVLILAPLSPRAMAGELGAAVEEAAALLERQYPTLPDPAVSVPRANATCPEATATADPELDPPEM
jgi:hypothetical protein